MNSTGWHTLHGTLCGREYRRRKKRWLIFVFCSFIQEEIILMASRKLGDHIRDIFIYPLRLVTLLNFVVDITFLLSQPKSTKPHTTLTKSLVDYIISWYTILTHLPPHLHKKLYISVTCTVNIQYLDSSRTGMKQLDFILDID